MLLAGFPSMLPLQMWLWVVLALERLFVPFMAQLQVWLRVREL